MGESIFFPYTALHRYTFNKDTITWKTQTLELSSMVFSMSSLLQNSVKPIQQFLGWLCLVLFCFSTFLQHCMMQPSQNLVRAVALRVWSVHPKGPRTHAGHLQNQNYFTVTHWCYWPFLLGWHSHLFCQITDGKIVGTFPSIKTEAPNCISIFHYNMLTVHQK